MKPILLSLLIAMLQLLTYAQRSHNLSISVNNNGQLEDVMDQFYFNASNGYNPNDDTYSYKQRERNFGIEYEYMLKPEWSFGASFRSGKRKDEFEVGNQAPSFYPLGDKSIEFFALSLRANRIWQWERFQFIYGIEFIRYSIDDYVENYIQQDDVSRLHIRITLSGGTAMGLNNYLQAKYFLGSKFFLSSGFRFGLVKFQVGDMLTSTIIDQEPVLYPEVLTSVRRTYDKVSITRPEFSFGVGFSLGKKRD